jgi:hypothetical protein
LDSKRIIAEGYSLQHEPVDLGIAFSTVATASKAIDKMVLSQNVPNPFNHSTVIKFTIPETGEVNWTLMDLTGRVVESWTRQMAKGDHSIKLEKERFEMSGVYYYKMNYNGYSEVKKLILLD